MADPTQMMPGTAAAGMPGMQGDPEGAGDTDSTVITIKQLPDGTFSVDISGDTDQPANPAEQASESGPQIVQTVADVCKLVQQELGEDADPKAMWQDEAAKRGPQGQPMAPGGAPQMSL